MKNKHKRILWLLNHKTLMPYEVKLMIELGYEVFTPKVIPQVAAFRSGAVDFSYDLSLSIPKRVLKRLNSFNFYEEEWPADIVTYVNRYFGAVFIIPYGKQVPEAIKKFEGQVVFRAFGLDNTQTYHNVLQLMFGERILADIAALGERFWFAGGYDQLVEVEPLLFSQREVFLPLGVPEGFWRTADTYVGTDRHILFVCPNAVTNPYYSAVYRKFKEEFGDLPHVIFGAQDVPVDDPHMLGFVSDEELARLYRDSAVIYYHSNEQRHVHYSPIEAAINGMPVIYYADSLLGRMTPEIGLGRCHSLEEARAAVERILGGDQEYIAAVCKQQRALAHKFSHEYCKEMWVTNLRERGLAAALDGEQVASPYWREFKRTVLTPFAHGLAKLPARVRPPKPPRELVTTAQTDDENLDTLADGIDFSQPTYPKFVEDITGVSFPEETGRWTEGDMVLISLNNPLPRRFRLEITGGAYGRNVNAAVAVRIGRTKRVFRFAENASTQQCVTLEFSTLRRGSLIQIRVPYPTIPPNDNRMVGLWLSRIRVLPAQRDTESSDSAEAAA